MRVCAICAHTGAQNKNLVPVLEDVGEERAIHIVTSTIRFLPAKTKAFIDMAAPHLRR